MDGSGEQNLYPGKKRAYPLEFKLMIVEEAKINSSTSEIARKHGIARSCIREWKRDELKIRAALENGQIRYRLEGGGKKAKCKSVSELYRQPL